MGGSVDTHVIVEYSALGVANYAEWNALTPEEKANRYNARRVRRFVIRELRSRGLSKLNAQVAFLQVLENFRCSTAR
jgi:hypothetical protein